MNWSAIVLVVAAGLIACSPSNPVDDQKREAQKAAAQLVKDNAKPMSMTAYRTEDTYYEVRQLCINEVSYLVYYHDIIPEVNKDGSGKPVSCK